MSSSRYISPMRLLRIDSHSHNELNITQSERNCGYSADRGCRIALRTKGEEPLLNGVAAPIG